MVGAVVGAATGGVVGCATGGVVGCGAVVVAAGEQDATSAATMIRLMTARTDFVPFLNMVYFSFKIGKKVVGSNEVLIAAYG
jgi:hypothetical protein